MNVRHQFQKSLTVKELFGNHFKSNLYEDDKLLFLIDLVHVFRPKNERSNDVISIGELIRFLEEHLESNLLFKKYLKTLIKKNKFSRLLSDSGIISDNQFFKEIRTRLFDKLLPYQPEKILYSMF